MESLRPMQSVLAFLTVLPTDRGHDITHVARSMYLFPVAGAVIGAIVGALAFGIIPFLDPLLVGLVVACAFVIITGVHHTDALADFADGLMAKGDREAKRKAMSDPAVGSAGVAALVLYFAGIVIAFHAGGFTPGLMILASIITAEVIAKYTMVLLAYRGRSAWEGSSSPFTAAMKDKRKILAATGIMLVIVSIASSYAGLVALAVSVAIAGVMYYASRKSFGGITGDVLGASNEVTRLVSLVVLSSVVL